MSEHKTRKQHGAQPMPQAPPAQTYILIAVDVGFIVQFGPGQGVYMCDNRVANGSTGEGTSELLTACNVGDVIVWECTPLDPNDSVTIVGFNVSSGNVFGSTGIPTQTGATWSGQAQSAGSQTYQITLLLVTGGTRPQTVTLNVLPFLTAQ